VKLVKNGTALKCETCTGYIRSRMTSRVLIDEATIEPELAG